MKQLKPNKRQIEGNKKHLLPDSVEEVPVYNSIIPLIVDQVTIASIFTNRCSLMDVELINRLLIDYHVACASNSSDSRDQNSIEDAVLDL